MKEISLFNGLETPNFELGEKNMVCQIYFSNKLLVILSPKQHKNKIFVAKQQRKLYIENVWNALSRYLGDSL